MAQRYSGTLRLRIRFTGNTDQQGRGEYKGNIHIPGTGNWEFNELYLHPAGDYNSPETFDRVAEAAIDFGGYYGNGNRDDDVPDWAPSEQIAEAIQSEQEWTVDEHWDFPEIAGVYRGESAIVFRSLKAQAQYQEVLGQKCEELNAKPQLTLIQGGLSDAA